MLDTLYSMLQDRDPQVVANCVTALEEVRLRNLGLRRLWCCPLGVVAVPSSWLYRRRALTVVVTAPADSGRGGRHYLDARDCLHAAEPSQGVLQGYRSNRVAAPTLLFVVADGL